MEPVSLHALLLVVVIAATTLLTRLLPFLLFSGKRTPPSAVISLGRSLPCAVMAMLVVYCLKDISPLTYPHAIPEALGVLTAACLHIWKRNTLLSIGGSTVVYMLLIQLVFP